MVLSTAVLFYFIGSFIPYKAKPFGGSHCSGSITWQSCAACQRCAFCFITMRECAKFCSYLISDKGKAVSDGLEWFKDQKADNR